MNNPTISLIKRRASANRFDPSYVLANTEIEELVRVATRAPTAYNLQNWRFIAVRDTETKACLRELAYGQQKVSDAAVTFIVCGLMPDSAMLASRLAPFVQSGHMPAGMAAMWEKGARDMYAHGQTARDEAVRSATLGAATLIYAAEAMGFASSPMSGFDPSGVTREFELEPGEVPVMLVTVGRAAPGNWPQKPRRPVSDVLEIV